MKRTKTSVKRSCDKLAGRLCRELNDYTCQRCNRRDLDPRISQWCHVKSRKFISVRYDMDNAFCLCASCHRFFTDQPDWFGAWIQDNYKDKHERLEEKFRSTSRVNLNWYLEKEQELKLLLKEHE